MIYEEIHSGLWAARKTNGTVLLYSQDPTTKDSTSIYYGCSVPVESFEDLKAFLDNDPAQAIAEVALGAINGDEDPAEKKRKIEEALRSFLSGLGNDG